MENRRGRKIKNAIVLGILVVAAIVGISHLRLQSVKNYQTGQKKQAESFAGIQGKETSATSKSGMLVNSKDKKTVENAKMSAKPKNSQAPKTSPNSKNNNKKTVDKKTSSGKKNKNNSTSSPKTTKKPGETNSSNENNSSTGTGDENNGGDNASQNSSSTETPKETEKPQEKTITCSIEIVCPKLVTNKGKVNAAYVKYIPADGNVLSKYTITVSDGTTVYGVLEKVCKAKNIQLDATYTPMYKSYYVKSIGYLYEKIAGDRSGWIYKVNGKSPNKGASSYVISDGDAITWTYTCDGKTS